MQTYHRRKLMLTCPRCDRTVLKGKSAIPRNAAIPLVGNIEDLLGGGAIISGGKLALNLLPDPKVCSAKFNCAGKLRPNA